MTENKSPDERKFRAAVIGLGKQALEDHIPAIEAMDSVDLVAVAEIDSEKLAGFLKTHPNVQGYRDWNDIFKNHSLDFVVIVLPHHLHFEAAKDALTHNVHVFKEKPLAISLKQGKELQKLADEHKVKISVTLQRRFNPIYSTFFQLIDKIGKPFYIDIKYTFFTEGPGDGWRGKKELAGGGCLLDMGYHIIDLLLWYFGLPDQVFAELSCDAQEHCVYNAEDTGQVIFKYAKNKMWGSLLVSRSIPPKQEYFNVYGTKGMIHIERGKIERFTASGVLQESLQRENSWPSAIQDQISYFLKVIVGEKENISDPSFHFNHLAFIEAAYQSAESHCYSEPKKFLANS